MDWSPERLTSEIEISAILFPRQGWLTFRPGSREDLRQESDTRELAKISQVGGQQEKGVKRRGLCRSGDALEGPSSSRIGSGVEEGRDG